MIQKQKIPDGVEVSVRPFGSTSNNNACVVTASVRRRDNKNVIRIFVRSLDDLHGMTIGDSIVLVTAIRAIVDEVKKAVEKSKHVVRHRPKGQSVSADRVRRQGKSRRSSKGKQRTRRAG